MRNFQLNQKPLLTLSNSRGAGTVALIWIGVSSCAVSTAGGELLVVPSTVLCFHVPATGLSLRTKLGDDDLMTGVDLFLQAIELDPGAAQGLSFTQGLWLELGG